MDIEERVAVDEDLVVGSAVHTARWFVLGAALVAGLLAARLLTAQPASQHSGAAPAARHHTAIRPTGRPAGLSSARGPSEFDAIGCPAYRACTSRRINSRVLLRTLRSDFTDLRRVRITATDDTATRDRYRVRVIATLARGLTVGIDADNAATGADEVTPWVFVGPSGGDASLRYASRTMQAYSADGPTLHITVAVTGSPPPREMRCESCQHLIQRSAAAARLQGLTRVAPGEIPVAVGVALRAVKDQHVLARFGRLRAGAGSSER